MEKYRWDYSIKWVTEFVRHDAEIALDIDGNKTQKAIKLNCHSNEEAEQTAIRFCKQLADKIEQLIENETKHLKEAKE